MLEASVIWPLTLRPRTYREPPVWDCMVLWSNDCDYLTFPSCTTLQGLGEPYTNSRSASARAHILRLGFALHENYLFLPHTHSSGLLDPKPLIYGLANVI